MNERKDRFAKGQSFVKYCSGYRIDVILSNPVSQVLYHILSFPIAEVEDPRGK